MARDDGECLLNLLIIYSRGVAVIASDHRKRGNSVFCGDEAVGNYLDKDVKHPCVYIMANKRNGVLYTGGDF